SVDEAYKHSYPVELEVSIANSTPASTYTPRYTSTPTPAPTVTATPTSTPRFNETFFRLGLNSTIFVGGDVLLLTAESYNNQEKAIWVNQVVLLDVFGAYYFHPNWEEEFMCTEKYLPSGAYFSEALLAVALPYDLEASGPYYFLGGIFDQENWLLLEDFSVVGFVFI
ncbi:hypothetical protein JW905_18355, partial [bacterium]|nr:hypothetical protein [candidate division CSSED10-310 bacterium]